VEKGKGKSQGVWFNAINAKRAGGGGLGARVKRVTRKKVLHGETAQMGKGRRSRKREVNLFT